MCAAQIASEIASGHEPVMLAETLVGLELEAGSDCIDGTFGGGGHAAAILEATAPDGRLLALDADPAAIPRALALQRSLSQPGRLFFVPGNFARIQEIAGEHGFDSVDGVLLDLGMSSFQVDAAERGFSFLRDGPLDMRFDPGAGVSAATLISTLPASGLADLLWRYGDERQSRRIAAAIVAERNRHPFETTSQLANLVERTLGGRRGSPTHPATRTFQALRIAVNDELAVLTTALNGAAALLRPGGRLVVISFHSLEDRIVKQFMAHESQYCICPPGQPICTCQHQPRLRRVGRAGKAGQDEIARNPRSRSAVLRVAERIAA